MGQGDFGGDPSNQYMDMAALMGGLAGLQPPGQGGAAPDQGQNAAQRSIIQRLFGGGGQHGAMPGSPMLPQMPNDSAFSNILPNRPRVAGALDNAALMASMIPGGATIGENISQVAGAMSEQPYARLMHAYQMMNPQLQAQMGVAQLGGLQAQTLETLGRGEYYRGENQAKVQAAQQQREGYAQIQLAKGTTHVMPDKNGNAIYRTLTEGQWQDDNGKRVPPYTPGAHVEPIYQDTPVLDKEKNPIAFTDWQQSGGMNPNTGLAGRPQDTYGPAGGMAALITGALMEPGKPENAKLIQAFKEYAGIQATAASGAHGDTPGQKDLTTQYHTQNTTMQDIENKLLSQNPLPTNFSAQARLIGADYDKYSAAEKKAGRQPISEADFETQWMDQRTKLRAAITAASSKYRNMPVAQSGERPDPEAFIRQELSAQTPTSGNQQNPY